VSSVLELEIGAVAHGGHCVARIGDIAGGRVVFVRHALPGERALVRVTEDAGGSFCRGDAVEILRASADRVAPPCAHAAPAGCGGCDWQHVRAGAQRRLKGDVVREQFRRLAGIDVGVEVEALPGGLLGWRTRTLYAVAPDGHLGLRRHRSHQVEVLDVCPLGAPGVGDHPAIGRRWHGATGIEVAGDSSQTSVLEHRPGRAHRQRGRRQPDATSLVEGPEKLHHDASGRGFDVSVGSFWQVHPAAAGAFAAAVLGALEPAPGETALDLYAGAGLFTALLAEAVGETGRVLGVESSWQAVADATANLVGLPWAAVRQGRVTAALVDSLDVSPSLVVLDPPRAGAGAATMRALVARAPRAIAYVACDPAALARDVAAVRECGWQLVGLRAFDAFPMTAHVECIAVLAP
jgi:tRNA/tmRNA/rRNA uracil-C5-methylase (TrmA/RlmC/RlmD family)